jgi:hypothetical protein
MLMRVRRMRMRLWGMSEVGGLLGWERESMQIRTTCCVRKSGVRLGADFHFGCVHLYKLGILMSREAERVLTRKFIRLLKRVRFSSAKRNID